MFLSGGMDDSDYKRLIATVTEDEAAARAEAEQHRAQAKRLRAELDQLDTSAEFGQRLTRLRQALAGEIIDAESIEALRATVSMFCDRVELDEVVDPAEGPDGTTLQRLRPHLLATTDLLADGEAPPMIAEQSNLTVGGSGGDPSHACT